MSCMLSIDHAYDYRVIAVNTFTNLHLVAVATEKVEPEPVLRQTVTEVRMVSIDLGAFELQAHITFNSDAAVVELPRVSEYGIH